MKKILLPAFTMACLAAHPVLAQTPSAYEHPELTKRQLIVEKPDPLVLVGTQETRMPALILNPERIKSMDVLKAGAEAKYGKKAKNGAVIISLKEQTNLARLEQIYAKYTIPKTQQTLRVAIDGKLVPEKEMILADLRDISKIEIRKQDVTDPARWGFNEDELYLHITTSIE
ncbi:hypothetical protein [Pontibacter vulgaris]|uniref:hypothetical protein n=1 Tax=Pontibacter vulgaris TaxID=2905679 RepID=UPI001FA7A2AA|nr:hypothetical protein [Pontibacter vulgaris]